ncbi:TRAP transporter large permease [Georgenia sp. AZ-5]|uniref:TRAP transporter large permease n=1 Tax=Georgenia sp. AZ-5 TaxID=3367526 RepID=UPI00375473AF
MSEDLAIKTATEPPAPRAERRAPKRYIGWRLLAPVVLVLAAFLMVQDLEPEAVGGIALGMMLVLTFMKVPIGIAMALPSVIGVWSIVGWMPTQGMLSRMPYDSVASWSLSVIPAFVFMGFLLWRSGVTERLYDVARHWIGWLPGGLAVGTNFAGAGLAAITGSSFATAYTLGRAGVPEMLKAGYDRRLAVGSVLAAGTLAHLIPPSIFMVIYAGIAEVPIGPQLMAGVGPGLLLAGVYAVAIVAISIVLVRKGIAGRGQVAKVTWSERMLGLVTIWPVPLLILLVVGSIFTGIFTATEAGAAGALGALAITAWARRKERPLSLIGQAAVSTVSTVGALFLLLIGAHMLTRLVSVSGLGDAFVQIVVGMDLSQTAFLIALAVAFLIMGIFMDALAMMLFSVPILLPVLQALEISEVWFGVFMVIFCELAVITPPVGVLAFTVAQIVQDKAVNLGNKISLTDVFTAAAYVVVTALVVVGLLVAFPDIALWLPNMMEQ